MIAHIARPRQRFNVAHARNEGSWQSGLISQARGPHIGWTAQAGLQAGTGRMAGHSNSNWKSGGPMKLLRTLRGDGVLNTEGGEATVSYQIDVFEQRNRLRSASGTLSGDLPAFDEDAENVTGTLRLEGGVEVAVTLDSLELDGADVRVTGEFPEL
jgi:hypothetical protein